MRSILLYSCETWPVRVADERMLQVFDNDSIRRILRVRRRDCVPSVELRRRLRFTSIPALLVQRRFRWFRHATRRPECELINDILLPTPPRTWCRRAGGQLKAFATTIKADLEPISGPRIFGHARWRKEWVNVSRAAKPGVPPSETCSTHPPVNADANTSKVQDIKALEAIDILLAPTRFSSRHL